MIEVSKLSKCFGEKTVVREVSFSVGVGEVVGLLGPNGAGKTTTMRMLTTFLEPDGGDARVAGASVRDDPQEVRRNLGYLPEGPPLYPEMSIPAFLGHLGRLRGLGRADRRRRIATMIDRCDLSDVLDREIGQLSRGYRQRVGLAATLLHDPAVLILDEPTTGLDPNQIVGIRGLIRSVAERRTVILSSHILSEVEATCDRVLILAEGQIKADDRTALIGSTRRSGSACYRIVLKGADEDAIQQLRAASFVEALLPVAVTARGTALDVTASSDDGDEQIFRWVAGRELVLKELRRTSTSLEQVFVDLTKPMEPRS